MYITHQMHPATIPCTLPPHTSPFHTSSPSYTSSLSHTSTPSHPSSPSHPPTLTTLCPFYQHTQLSPPHLPIIVQSDGQGLVEPCQVDWRSVLLWRPRAEDATQRAQGNRAAWLKVDGSETL